MPSNFLPSQPGDMSLNNTAAYRLIDQYSMIATAKTATVSTSAVLVCIVLAKASGKDNLSAATRCKKASSQSSQKVVL